MCTGKGCTIYSRITITMVFVCMCVYTAIYICGNDPSKLREFSLRFGIINGNLDVAIPSDVV